MTPRSPVPPESRSEQPASPDGDVGASSNGSTNGSHPDDGDAARNGADRGSGAHNGAVPVGDGFAVSESFVAEQEVSESEEDERITGLEERLERLSSICEAMWDLVSEELDLELEGLRAKLAEMGGFELLPTMAAIDEGSICPNCENTKPVEAELCLFCSARHAIDDDIQ